MIRFILNEKELTVDLPPGTVLLDLIRYHQQLKGTKVGCREGDCGACTVLVGELKNGELEYRSMTSCLMPLANAQGKHIVTIEGINFPGKEGLNPIQQAMADEGATQCGFCTPGFVMSLAGFCLDNKEATAQQAIAAIDGNICRCTGYKSIERAALKITAILKERQSEQPAAFAAHKKILPGYFTGIKERLSKLKSYAEPTIDASLPVLSGGTDLYVQKHDELAHASLRFVFDDPALKGITVENGNCYIGAAATVSDLKYSKVFNTLFPGFQDYAKLVSSTPIRNMATIAGNFINASPIGDMTIFFLALDAQLLLKKVAADKKETTRTLPLRNLYKGYKQLNKEPAEYIERIWFALPASHSLFHFEKVSKRTHLDIASVNSAISLVMHNNTITSAGLSAGGVGPVPLYLVKTSAFLSGKNVSDELVHEAIGIARSEISPISDARGSKEYKSLLLGQLIKAHFIRLFPKIKINLNHVGQ